MGKKPADSSFCRRSKCQITAKFETNRLLHEAEKRQRRIDREMSKHLHVSLPPATSCPYWNNICRSRIRLLIHLRAHDRRLEDVILVSMFSVKCLFHQLHATVSLHYIYVFFAVFFCVCRTPRVAPCVRRGLMEATAVATLVQSTVNIRLPIFVHLPCSKRLYIVPFSQANASRCMYDPL